MTNLTANNIALVVEDGAHHYDLRLPNDKDTNSVKSVRETEFHYIKNWVEEYQQQNLAINLN